MNTWDENGEKELKASSWREILELSEVMPLDEAFDVYEEMCDCKKDEDIDYLDLASNFFAGWGDELSNNALDAAADSLTCNMCYINDMAKSFLKIDEIQEIATYIADDPKHLT